jgi:hypothetical protein
MVSDKATNVLSSVAERTVDPLARDGSAKTETRPAPAAATSPTGQGIVKAAAPEEPSGVSKERSPLAVELKKTTVELTAVSAEVRRRTDEFYLNDPEVRKMALETERIRGALQKRMAEAPGRRAADEDLRRCGAELQSLQTRIRELETDLQAPPTGGAGPRDSADIRKQIEGLQAQESEANRDLAKAKTTVA